MARIRTVKPSMWKSFTVSAWNFELRWLFAGLLTYCDDYGRGSDDARLIKSDLFALDDKVTAGRVERYLQVIACEGDDPPICRYQGDDGRAYLHFPKWRDHQKISHPTPSALPPCSVHGGEDFRNHSRITPERLQSDPEKASAGIRNKEGNREEAKSKTHLQSGTPDLARVADALDLGRAIS